MRKMMIYNRTLFYGSNIVIEKSRMCCRLHLIETVLYYRKKR